MTSPVATAAATIRAAPKAHGWSARQVSVRSSNYSMGSSISVTIKSAAVPLSIVEKIANNEQRVDRCKITGEILSGGNRYVSVSYDREALAELAGPIDALLATVEGDPGATVELSGGWRAWKDPGQEDYWSAHRGGLTAGRSEVYCWGRRFCAEQIVIAQIEATHAPAEPPPTVEPAPEPFRPDPETDAPYGCAPLYDVVQRDPGDDPPPSALGADGLTAHQRARKVRAEARASRLAAKASAQLEGARASIALIPAGQPILIGHHSEKRHRRDLARHDAQMRRGIETAKEAKRAEWSAAGAGRAISSDDPDALDALEVKLAELEARRDRYKATNRKLRAAGEEALPSYVLANIGANIHRVKNRIAELKRAAERVAAPEIVGEGFRIEQCPEDNRIRFYFDTRPDRETCKAMKRAGFRYSPNAGAWQRHLNNAGVYACERMARELFGWSVEP